MMPQAQTASTKKTTKKAPPKKVTAKKKAKEEVKIQPVSILDIAKEDDRLTTAVDVIGSDSADTYLFECPPIDISFGGGIKSGKIYEFMGWESQGKSTLALETSKTFGNYWSAKGEKNWAVLWIETESALDKPRAYWMGVPIDKFLISECETVEEGFELMLATLEKAEAKGMKLFIVWDTIAAAPTKAELEGGQYSGGMADKPKMIRYFLRKVTNKLGKTDSTLIFVNQLSAKINSMPGAKKDDSPGGGGIKYHASVRTRLTQMGKIMETNKQTGNENQVGIVTQIQHVKNKLTLPNMAVKLSIRGETGIDFLDTSLRYLKENKLCKTAGAGWVTINVPEETQGPPKKGEQPKKVNYIEAKFQTTKKLEELIEMKYPHLKQWIDYLIYESFTRHSPLVKAKIIQKVWWYEMLFFGEHRTELTEKEKHVAQMMHQDLDKKYNKDEFDEANYE